MGQDQASNSVTSIKKRYFFSLLANIMLCVPRLLNASLLPRALGPSGYGDFQFLINNFISLKNFLDLGSSTAFFTSNAKNENSKNLNVQYFLWLVFQLFIILTLVFSAIALDLHGKFWPGQTHQNIVLAALAVWIFSLAQQFVQFGDARGQTIIFQKINLFTNYFSAALLSGFYYYGAIGLGTAIFLYSISPFLIITASIFKFYRLYFRAESNLLEGFRDNAAFFKSYCSPLIVYIFLGFCADFLDRWMLQKFGGSAEQGYYSLSYNWAAISLLFFNPLLNIFWREVSVLDKQKATAEIGAIFLKFVKLLFVITAFISVFLFFNVSDILMIIAGKKFAMAAVPFMIMIFFPLIQVYGQLAGNIYFATEAVKLYRDIGVVMFFVSTIITYFVIAPTDYFIPGFALGANGFSAKVFLVNLICTDISVYIICKRICVDYFELVRHRLTVMVLLVAVYLAVFFLTSGIASIAGSYMVFLLRFSMFGIICFFIFNRFYGLLGLPKRPAAYLKLIFDKKS